MATNSLEAMPTGTARLSTTLPMVRKEELDVLRQRAGLMTMSDLINKALTVFEFLVDQRRAGSTLYIKDKDGVFHPVMGMP